MEERRELIPSTHGQIPLTIRDIANIVITSSELTGLVVGAITKAVGQGLVKGIKEIYLVIDGLRTELAIIKMAGDSQRDIIRSDIRRACRLTNFEHTVRDYKAAKARIMILKSTDEDDFYKEWLRRVEESFYKEMAQIMADF